MSFILLGTRGVHVPNEGCIASARYIYNEIFKDSVYENGIVRVMPGDVVLDVGANIGLFTMYALDQGASHVIALEPDPECVVAFLKNNHANRQAVHLHPLGASYGKKECTFVSYHTHKGSSFIASPGQFVKGSPSDCKVFKIDCAPIDTLLHPEERIDFLKMDIEGSEMSALLGARDTIKRCRPKLSISVYHKPEDVMEIPAYIRSIVSEYDFIIEDSPSGYNEKIAKFWIPGKHTFEKSRSRQESMTACYKGMYGKSPVELMLNSISGE